MESRIFQYLKVNEEENTHWKLFWTPAYFKQVIQILQQELFLQNSYPTTVLTTTENYLGQISFLLWVAGIIKNKATIMKNSHRLKGTSHYVNEDFSKEILAY